MKLTGCSFIYHMKTVIYMNDIIIQITKKIKININAYSLDRKVCEGSPSYGSQDLKLLEAGHFNFFHKVQLTNRPRTSDLLTCHALSHPIIVS